MSRKLPQEDVFQIRLGAFASLDIVRDRDERIFLVVFAERGVVQRRTLVKIEYVDAG